MWIALINMEHKYGSMQTLENAFERAVAESKVITMCCVCALADLMNHPHVGLQQLVSLCVFDIIFIFRVS